MVGGVGLSDAELREQLSSIRDIAADFDIDVFAGVEANIARNGDISVGAGILESVDIVVASPHADLDGAGTDRLVEAAQHPDVDIIGHPTGRYVNQRAGLDVDIERLATVAAEHDTALEVNANPNRLDLGDSAIKTVVEAGAPLTVNTDAHRPSNFELLRFGIHTARRGWAESGDVLNTREATGIRSFVE